MAGPVSGLGVASIQVLVSGSQTTRARHSVSSAQVNVDGPVDSPQPMRMSAVMIRIDPRWPPDEVYPYIMGEAEHSIKARCDDSS